MLEAILYGPSQGPKLLIIGRIDALHFVPNFSKKIVESFLELFQYTRPVTSFESRSYCIVRVLIFCYHEKQLLYSLCSLGWRQMRAHPSKVLHALVRTRGQSQGLSLLNSPLALHFFFHRNLSERGKGRGENAERCNLKTSVSRRS